MGEATSSVTLAVALSRFCVSPMPAFSTPLAQQQIHLLMQPALIRVIDNIRKQLEELAWQSRYEDDVIWPAQTTEEQKQQFMVLQQMLDNVDTENQDELLMALSQLPQPQHIYTLILTDANPERRIDIWQLCYQICCQNYDALNPALALEADTNLFDPELADVDWVRLDEKAKVIVHQALSATA
jgi:hypothetical protein